MIYFSPMSYNHLGQGFGGSTFSCKGSRRGSGGFGGGGGLGGAGWGREGGLGLFFSDIFTPP